jgi:hypothetical protein
VRKEKQERSNLSVHPSMKAGQLQGATEGVGGGAEAVGLPRLHVLLERERHEINDKRMYRLYRKEGLQVRRRKRRKRAVRPRRILAVPSQANERWSMDFVHDQLASGRRLRCLTVVDDFTREAVAIEVDHSIGGVRVAEVLDRAGRRRGWPAAIVCDNGPEFTSRALDVWAYERGIEGGLQPGPAPQLTRQSHPGALCRAGRDVYVKPARESGLKSGPNLGGRSPVPSRFQIQEACAIADFFRPTEYMVRRAIRSHSPSAEANRW